MCEVAKKTLFGATVIAAVILLAAGYADAATFTVDFSTITQGTSVDLSVQGPLDWVHWGLYTESSLDRKAGVSPSISDFTVLYSTNGYAFVYQFADNYN